MAPPISRRVTSCLFPSFTVTRLVPVVGWVGGTSGKVALDESELGEEGEVGDTTFAAKADSEDFDAFGGKWLKAWSRLSKSVFPTPVQPTTRLILRPYYDPCDSVSSLDLLW